MTKGCHVNIELKRWVFESQQLKNGFSADFAGITVRVSALIEDIVNSNF